MRIKDIHNVNDLVTKRKEIKQKLNSIYVPKKLEEEYFCLKITVEISANDDWGCKYVKAFADAKDIKVTKCEAERLLTLVKTYNEEELFRVENELKRLGVELESKNSCDNETTN